jgi:hypothetical protein
MTPIESLHIQLATAENKIKALVRQVHRLEQMIADGAQVDPRPGSVSVDILDLPQMDDPPTRPLRVVEQTPTTGLGAIAGKWPGDETEEELLTALREVRGKEPDE